MKSSRSGSTTTLTHAHTRTHTPTEPGLVLIGDVWFANLREERKEESTRVRVRRRKGKHPGTTLRARKTPLPLSVLHPGSARPLSSLRATLPRPHSCSLTPHHSRAAQMKQPGKLEGCGVGSQFSPSPPPSPSSSSL